MSLRLGLRSFCVVLIVSVCAFGFSGCSEDDPVSPLPATGTIIISCTPDTLSASWTLGPPSMPMVTGQGDSILTGLETGRYILEWSDIAGWSTPDPGQGDLATGDTLRFGGVYEFVPPPIVETVLVAPGDFIMGSPGTELGRDPGEITRSVTLTRAFLIMTREVTNREFMEMAEWAVAKGHAIATQASIIDFLDGSFVELLDLDSDNCEIDVVSGVFSCVNPDHPVKEVTWYGAAAFCDWLSLHENLPRAYDHSTWLCNGGDPYGATGFRLPVEAEWEYACRAGTPTAFNGGEITKVGCDDPLLDGLAWYCGNAGTWTHPGGTKTPNAWGLYDMHGNVWEWCNDSHQPYAAGDVSDPVVNGPGTSMVIRGGHCRSYANYCRSAARHYAAPSASDYYIGFRVVRTTE